MARPWSAFCLCLLAAACQFAAAAPAMAQVSVDVEPRASTFVLGGMVVHWLPVAPPKAGGQEQARLCLRVAITNGGANTLQLTKVTISWGAKQFPIALAAPLAVPPTGSNPPTLWVNQTSNCPLISTPAPQSGALTLSFNGPPGTQKTLFFLAAHDGPNYHFPFRHSDRPAGEFWQANSTVHGVGTQGSQLFAYDMTVVGFDKKTNVWTQLKADANGNLLSGNANTDYRSWGTPIYAMADGTVVHCEKAIPANPQPNGCCIPGQSCTNTDVQKTNGTITRVHPGSGNSFYIQHSPDEIVLYAHMQPADATCSNFYCAQCKSDGTGQVKKGDLLGHVGNSGNVCGAPHLHIHSFLGSVNATGYEVAPLTLRPLPFAGASMLQLDPNNKMGPTAPWFKASKHGPPSTWAAICNGNDGPVPANVKAIPGELTTLAASFRLFVKQERLFQQGKRKTPPDGDPETVREQINLLLSQLNAFNKGRCPADTFCPNCANLAP